MFFVALLLVCFGISNQPTRIFVAVTSVMVAVLVGWCVLWSWRSGDSGKVCFNGLLLSIARAFGHRSPTYTPYTALGSSVKLSIFTRMRSCQRCKLRLTVDSVGVLLLIRVLMYL